MHSAFGLETELNQSPNMNKLVMLLVFAALVALTVGNYETLRYQLSNHIFHSQYACDAGTAGGSWHARCS